MKFISKEERAKLSDEDFAYISGDLRLFPILEFSDIKKCLDFLDKSTFSDDVKVEITNKVNQIAETKNIKTQVFNEDSVEIEPKSEVNKDFQLDATAIAALYAANYLTPEQKKFCDEKLGLPTDKS